MKYHQPRPNGEPFQSPNGHVYHVNEWHARQEKAKYHPGELTDEDLAIIESFDGTGPADKAAAARERALRPPVPPVAAAPASVDLTSLREATRFIVKAFDREPDPNFDRSRAEFEVRAQVAREVSVVPGAYDRIKFMIALGQFQQNPSGLTDGDLAQLSMIDPDLGDQARAARAGYSKAVEDEGAEALSQMPVSILGLKTYLARLEDTFSVWIKTAIHKVREAHVRLDVLEQRLVDPKDAGTQLPQALLQIKALVERVNFLEARPTMEYKGVLEPGKTYKPGHAVTWKGHIWVCRVETTAAPVFGEGPTVSPRPWTLAVKAGRDGKDAPSLSR